MKILGISAFYHDSAAAIIENGRVLAAAQEERFTRKKQDAAFPKEAITYCLQETGTSIDELAAVVFYDKPLLKFERLLETYYAFIPKGLASFISAMPVWLKEKLFLKKLIREGLTEIEAFDRKQLKLLFPEHHLSHAASTFYPSPFEEAAILTIDGVGEWATASICYGKGKEIKIIK
ncbi:MAG: carbamoyltransferase N-terminal domain-containing protein, partial [Bacteroidota bacterium]